jgi:hypothetical protein
MPVKSFDTSSDAERCAGFGLGMYRRIGFCLCEALEVRKI